MNIYGLYPLLPAQEPDPTGPPQDSGVFFNWSFHKAVGLPMSLSAFGLHKLLILVVYSLAFGAGGSVVGWDTMLQVGRSSVRVPDEVDFFNLSNPSSRTVVLGLTQPLTEMSTRNFPAGKKWPAPRADNPAAIYEPNVWKCGSLNLSQP
jgi:hypothetical protein